jgi:hypothetical protein
MVGGYSIIVKNFEDAYKVAKILDDNYHQTAIAKFIFSIAWCCDHIPVTHQLLLLLNGIRNKILNTIGRKKDRSLQNQFGEYSRFLKEEDSVLVEEFK